MEPEELIAEVRQSELFNHELVRALVDYLEDALDEVNRLQLEIDKLTE